MGKAFGQMMIIPPVFDWRRACLGLTKAFRVRVLDVFNRDVMCPCIVFRHQSALTVIAVVIHFQEAKALISTSPLPGTLPSSAISRSPTTDGH